MSIVDDLHGGVLDKVVERYADHPAVIGYQVDNEPGLHLLHNHGIFQRFVNRLREQYGDVQTLRRLERYRSRTLRLA
ncbi:beta-galactosidase [Nonomuraea sp. NPDC049695]|uniref:beta-galactosidase n=1 Tax=Nonomuraea sp. NPDC049695 TaxID=3154734 RepID=UPI0034302B07